MRGGVEEEFHGPNGVIVAGDGVIHDVRIAVGIHDGDDWDFQFAGLGHGVMFALEINNENGVRQAFHVADAAEVFKQSRLLAAEAGLFLFDVAGDAAVRLHRLDVLELLEGFFDGFEIGERAAEPTLGDARLAGGFGEVADGRLRLFFGADKQHLAAAAHLGGHKIAGDVE